LTRDQHDSILSLDALGPQKKSTWPILSLLRTDVSTKKQDPLRSPHRRPTYRANPLQMTATEDPQ
jgi:hypothetical protein